jgi:hypothetical protein
LVLYDPRGDDPPVATIARPGPDDEHTRRIFARVIKRFNRKRKTHFVMGVCDVTEGVLKRKEHQP